MVKTMYKDKEKKSNPPLNTNTCHTYMHKNKKQNPTENAQQKVFKRNYEEQTSSVQQLAPRPIVSTQSQLHRKSLHTKCF